MGNIKNEQGEKRFTKSYEAHEQNQFTSLVVVQFASLSRWQRVGVRA